jgi:hypothetical protein
MRTVIAVVAPLITPGIRVTIWYWSAGERWLLAAKVCVLPAAAAH